MFKKVLQSISKSLQRSTPAEVASPAKVTAKPEVRKESAPAPKEESALKRIVALPAAAAPAKRTPEDLCGVDAKMNKEQIRDRLKLLYRRHNRAASSLDPKTRAEADSMLNAIVSIREKTFGAI